MDIIRLSNLVSMFVITPILTHEMEKNAVAYEGIGKVLSLSESYLSFT